MFVDSGHKSTGLKDAVCLCTCCEQSRKPDKITKLITSGCCSGSNLMSASMAERESGIGLLQAKIISMSAARQSAEQMRMYKLRQANFKYPMLECS